MKKGWKIFWIIYAVLAAVGIFLAIAGTALGGLVLLRDNRDEEIVRSWLDRIGIRHEVRVTSEVQAVPDVPGSLEDDGYVPGEPDGKNVTAYEGIDELDLELTGMGIRMIPYEAEPGTTRDGESIIVDISGCREDLRDLIKVSHSGTTLKVEMEDRGWAGTQDSGILYISVMNNMSVDCDCVATPEKPALKDYGILASLDPVALDQACVDIIFNMTASEGNDNAPLKESLRRSRPVAL